MESVIVIAVTSYSSYLNYLIRLLIPSEATLLVRDLLTTGVKVDPLSAKPGD